MGYTMQAPTGPWRQHRHTRGSTAAGLPLGALLAQPLQKAPWTALAQRQSLLSH